MLGLQVCTPTPDLYSAGRQTRAARVLGKPFTKRTSALTLDFPVLDYGYFIFNSFNHV